MVHYTPTKTDVIKHIFISLTGEILLNKTVYINKVRDDVIPKLAVTFAANSKPFKISEGITPYICCVDCLNETIEKEITLISEDDETLYIPITEILTSDKNKFETTIKLKNQEGTIYSYPFTILIN